MVVLIFSGPVAKPIAPPSRMIDAPVIESSPIAKDIMTMIGANAMKRFTPCVVQIRPKTSVRIGRKMYTLPENAFAIFAITACSAPVFVRRWNAPPANRMTSMRSMRFTNALTIYSGISSGFTGVRSM